MSTAPINITRDASQGVREDTAELASWALSDIASIRSEHSPSRHLSSSAVQHHSYLSSQLDQGDLTRHDSNSSSRPEAIQEVSEPTSPGSSQSSQQSRCQSALAEMIRNSPPTEEDSDESDEDESPATADVHPVTVREGIISQPSEQTTLLGKRTAYGSIKDLEGQRVARPEPMNRIRDAMQQYKAQFARTVRMAFHPKLWQYRDGMLNYGCRMERPPESWTRQNVLKYGVRIPASFVPCVLLGLLLTILDALSYGEPREIQMPVTANC